ncbi:peptidoglycan-binding protein [Streptomyces sp. NBC_00876]|uniref:peptidoglycan-binding domain-containing protein n=1 Tax=Streptomyces sp. NBC_00876 TaxID=2975853 RepID=UPI00386322D0|nr:peptidoglycan-binding protein [Streptomyces sp. NBC_00876]
MTGHICPECGTDNRPGTGPGCACANRAAHGGAGPPRSGAEHHVTAEGPVTDQERAAEQQRITEQHHAERSAQMAAAEDFDPLRIRPYVTLGGEETAADDAGHPQGYAPGGQPGDAASTMPLFLDPAGPMPDEVDPVRPADAADTALLTTGPDPVQPRRRKPFAALVAGAAVVTVVGAAAFVGGLFNRDGSGEADLDQALPSTVTSLPEESAEPSTSEKASASASPSRPASAPASATASPSGPATASASSSASASAPGAGSGPGPAAPSSPAATAGSSKPADVAPPGPSADGPTLRLGDHGPEVAELQRRLQEVWLFHGPDDADYTDRVEKAVHDFQSSMYIQGDPDGVYGPNTRRLLEAVTTGQGRR